MDFSKIFNVEFQLVLLVLMKIKQLKVSVNEIFLK